MMKDYECLNISCQKSEQRDEPPDVHFSRPIESSDDLNLYKG